MKILNNYVVPGALDVTVGSVVHLYLDQVSQPGFPEFIEAEVKHPIVPVKCGSSTSYSFEYDEADLLGATALLIPADVVDVVVANTTSVTQEAIENAILDEAGFRSSIGAASAAQGALADTALQPEDGVLFPRLAKEFTVADGGTLTLPNNTDVTAIISSTEGAAFYVALPGEAVEGQTVILKFGNDHLITVLYPTGGSTNVPIYNNDILVYQYVDANGYLYWMAI